MQILAVLHNIHKSPLTTAIGVIVGGLLAVTNQPDAKHLAIALGIAILGGLAKEQ